MQWKEWKKIKRGTSYATLNLRQLGKQYYFILILALFFNCSFLKSQNQQYDLDDSLNPYIELVEIFLSDFFDTATLNCNNITAIEVFEQRIDTLKNHTNKKRENIFGNSAYFVINFVLLTGIETELAGDYIGYYNPTSTDLEKWIEWFQEHKDKLCLYKEKNILYLKKDLQKTR